MEAAALDRGQILKRHVRAAAAMNELYDDTALAHATDVGRGTVLDWWRGAKPKGETLFRLADATGLSADELTRFLYSDGPPPSLPEAGSPVASSVQEGLRRDQERQQPGAPDMPSGSQKRRPHGSGAGRA